MLADRAPKRVLIIDDDEWVRTAATVALESMAGWSVRLAGSVLAGSQAKA
jgi:DNA-binding NtrC family response regulator